MSAKTFVWVAVVPRIDMLDNYFCLSYRVGKLAGSTRARLVSVVW